MQAVEFAILNWIQAHCASGILDAAAPFVSALTNHGEIWITLALVLLALKKHRRAGIILAVALLLDLVVCNGILKPLVGRVRPCDINTAVRLLIPRPTDASFPSGHTAVSFAAVSALRTAGEPLWIPALVLAAAIAFSRLYLYVHWPSDVLAGMVLGWLLGILAEFLVRAQERRLKSR